MGKAVSASVIGYQLGPIFIWMAPIAPIALTTKPMAPMMIA